MDELRNDALEIRQQQVTRCPLILDVLFKYFNLKDFLQVRSVCTLWNEYTIEMCKRKSIYFNINMTIGWKIYGPILPPSKSLKLDNCLSALPEDELPKSILNVAKLTLDWGTNPRKLWTTDNAIYNGDDYVSDELFFLAKYGHMIKNLKICVVYINEMLRILRLCQNLEVLYIDIQVPELPRGINFTIGPDFSIVNRLSTEETMVLKSLHTFSLNTMLPWEFGPFLKLVAPNLRNIGFIDQSSSPNHTFFINQLEYLNSENLQSVHYETLGEVRDFSSFFHKFMEFDFSSLRRINFKGSITRMRPGLEQIQRKYLELIQTFAKTLRSLDFTGEYGIYFMNGFMFPYLPKVTNATLHHSVINTPDFFGKLPALGELSLKSSDRDVRLLGADDNPESLVAGFFIENSSMWNMGNGWTPHQTLKTLDIQLTSRNFMIPLTFGRMFPNLIKIHVEALGDEALVQLQNLLTQVNEWPRLKTLAMFIGEISNGLLLTIFILIGIPRVNWDAAYTQVMERNSIELREFITESPLSNLPQSATVSLEHYAASIISHSEFQAICTLTLSQVILKTFCSDSSVTFKKIRNIYRAPLNYNL